MRFVVGNKNSKILCEKDDRVFLLLVDEGFDHAIKLESLSAANEFLAQPYKGQDLRGFAIHRLFRIHQLDELN